MRAGIEGASLSAGLVVAGGARLAFYRWPMLGVFHKAPMNGGRDMEEIIRDNYFAYRAAYEAMYPKEFNCHSWDEIEGEWLRVQVLNCRKARGAKTFRLTAVGLATPY